MGNSELVNKLFASSTAASGTALTLFYAGLRARLLAPAWLPVCSLMPCASARLLFESVCDGVFAFRATPEYAHLKVGESLWKLIK